MSNTDSYLMFSKFANAVFTMNEFLWLIRPIYLVFNCTIKNSLTTLCSQAIQNHTVSLIIINIYYYNCNYLNDGTEVIVLRQQPLDNSP